MCGGVICCSGATESFSKLRVLGEIIHALVIKPPMEKILEKKRELMLFGLRSVWFLHCIPVKLKLQMQNGTTDPMRKKDILWYFFMKIGTLRLHIYWKRYRFRPEVPTWWFEQKKSCSMFGWNSFCNENFEENVRILCITGQELNARCSSIANFVTLYPTSQTKNVGRMFNRAPKL